MERKLAKDTVSAKNDGESVVKVDEEMIALTEQNDEDTLTGLDE